MSDKFKFVMPAFIQKSEDGEYKISGLASTESVDLQGETIIQKGIDLTPVQEGKGFFNFDHSNKPEDLIGTIDGYRQGPEGLFVHGRLFKGHQRAEAVYSIMKALDERKKGAVGMSVEGKVLERDPKDPKKITKCQIKNVAITFNPVNPNTYTSLMKSLSVDAVEFDASKENALAPEEVVNAAPESTETTFTAAQVVEIVQKALTAGAAGMVAPVDRSGGEALSVESLEKEEELVEAPEVLVKKKLKKLSKSLYKSGIESVLDKLQDLYPEYSREVLWHALKDRLNKKYY